MNVTERVTVEPMEGTNDQFVLTAEQRQLQSAAREIAQGQFAANALHWEATEEFPWENIRALARAGLLGLTIPTDYGGGGASWLEAALVLEEIGKSCYVTAMAALGEVGVQVQAISTYGSESQKQKYLPSISEGNLICSVCITEPQAGSDISAIETTVTSSEDGLVISGTKDLIARADVAGLFLVFARRQMGDAKEDFAVILVESAKPGVQIGGRQRTLGGEGLYRIDLDRVPIEAEDILISSQGFRLLLEAFNGQRCLNAAISVGIAQGAQDTALAYAKERVQGGAPISQYQGLQWMLADNAIEIEAARSLVQRACALTSRGFPSRMNAAIAKTFANEMSLRVTDRVMQVFGGHGWLTDMPAERYVRWARYGALGGGTPQVQRNGIARSLLRDAQ